MSTATTDHYEVLGVARDATSAIIKSAYLRLIREHTPENDPNKFRLVSEAYRTLSNQEKRKEYDRGDRLSEGVARKLDAISRTIESDPRAAIDSLRALLGQLGQQPGYRRVALLLGVTLSGEERYSEAVAVFESLADSDPTDLTARVWLGDSLVKSGNAAQGKRMLREVIVRDKGCTEAYISYARACTSLNEHAEAAATLQRGIEADGSIDIKDLPLFVQRIFVLSMMSDWAQLEATARQLLDAVLKEDLEARQYVATAVWPLAQAYMEANRADLLHFILDIVVQCDPTKAEARNLRDNLTTPARSQRARPAFYGDPQVAQWLKALIALWSGDEEPADKEGITRVLVGTITSRASQCKNEFSVAVRRHPDALAPFRDQWEDLSRTLERVAPTKSGCLVLALLIPSFGSALGALL